MVTPMSVGLILNPNLMAPLSQVDLKSFLEWAAVHRGIGMLVRVAAAAPSAELTGAEGAQLDEEDMGMSYSELGDLGYCRKVIIYMHVYLSMYVCVYVFICIYIDEEDMGMSYTELGDLGYCRKVMYIYVYMYVCIYVYGYEYVYMYQYIHIYI